MASNGAAAAGGGDASASNQADYSPQWAEYYRSLGKIKEAEAIEAQMKQKVNNTTLIGHYEPFKSIIPTV